MHRLLLVITILFFTGCKSGSNPSIDDTNIENNTEEQDLTVENGEDNIDDGIEIPSNEFKNEYTLADFDLNGKVDYLEIRYSITDKDTDSLRYSVLQSFDQFSFDSLENVQKVIIENASSVSGFTGGGFPTFHPIYGVALTDYSATIMSSWDELLEVFGELDTEAELKIWLDYKQDWTIDHGPIFMAHRYQEIEDGYLVLFVWKDDCDGRPQEIHKILRDGTLEKIKELNVDIYDGCI